VTTELILVPVASGEFLALAPEEFSRARRKAAEVLGDGYPGGERASKGGPAVPETLLDAAAMGALTNMPASWFAAAATRQEIPHYRFGRWVRFRASEVLASEDFVKRVGKENPRADKLPPSRHELRLMKGRGGA
jgi:hypothetical protein